MKVRLVKAAGRLRHLGGWRKEPADHRDLKLAVPGQIMPPRVMLFSVFPPVNDQGAIGTCVGNGTCEVFECTERRDGSTRRIYSRLYVYFYGRKLEGVPPGEDSGMLIRDGVKVLATRGACLETAWPYSDQNNQFAVQPPPECDTEAAQHKALFYYRCAGPTGVASLLAMRSSIAQGFPVVFGFNVPENFMSDECAETGILHYPGPHEKYEGGHCVVAGGYDDNMVIDGVPGAFLCRNSWGEGWGCDDDGGTTGRRGNFWLPYRYVTDSIADDPWTIRRSNA